MSAVRTLVPPNLLTRRSRHLFTEFFIFSKQVPKIGDFLRGQAHSGRAEAGEPLRHAGLPFGPFSSVKCR
jgi:hypothetical protein